MGVDEQREICHRGGPTLEGGSLNRRTDSEPLVYVQNHRGEQQRGGHVFVINSHANLNRSVSLQLYLITGKTMEYYSADLYRKEKYFYDVSHKGVAADSLV